MEHIEINTLIVLHQLIVDFVFATTSNRSVVPPFHSQYLVWIVSPYQSRICKHPTKSLKKKLLV